VDQPGLQQQLDREYREWVMERQASRQQLASLTKKGAARSSFPARIAGLHLRILFCHNPLLLIVGWLLGLPLRASNEHILLIFSSSPEAPMLVQLPTFNPISFLSIKSSGQTAWCGLNCAHRGAASLHSLLHDPSLLIVGWSACSPIARVQRGPSEAARCASTGDQQATPLPPFLDKKKKRRL